MAIRKDIATYFDAQGALFCVAKSGSLKILLNHAERGTSPRATVESRAEQVTGPRPNMGRFIPSVIPVPSGIPAKAGIYPLCLPWTCYFLKWRAQPSGDFSIKSQLT